MGRTGSSCQVHLLIISSLFANLIESRCIEHTVHLGAAAFIKAVAPKMKNWTKNCTGSVEDANEDDDNDDEEWVADWNQLDVIPDEELSMRRSILSQVIHWERLLLS